MCSKKLSSVYFILFGLLLFYFPTQAIGSSKNVGSPARGGPLTFEERVAYQRAIEEVYWQHRTWPKENPGPKPPLGKVMPDTAIAAKVEDYLRKSNALEQYWNRPITAEQLQAEMDRMVKQTKQPAMLKEIFASLNNDPHVIAECLARPLLVDRFVHSFYASDEQFHGKLKAQAQSELKLYGDAAMMKVMSGHYQKIVLKRQDAKRRKIFDAKSLNALSLDADEWDGWIQHLQRTFGGGMDPNAMRGLLSEPRLAQKPSASLPINQLSGLQEDADRFYVTAILEKDNSHVKLATVEWKKRSFEDWWKESSVSMPVEIAAPSFAYHFSASLLNASPCTHDTWAEGGTSVSGPPTARYNHTAVWTGTEMIVWGGIDGNGGRYDPSTNSWAPNGTSTINAPTGRYFHTAIWTGKEMIIWGGQDDQGILNSGGRYDPLANTWAPTTKMNAKALDVHTAVWTGTEMIVWGGLNQNGFPTNTGGRYDPNTDSWKSTSNVNVTQVRFGHSAVWTGTEMIVWGGLDTNHSPLKSGGRYNPSSDTWTLSGTNILNAPAERQYHTAIWTGNEMIIWGGSGNSGELNSGARYDPSTDSWFNTSTTNSPSVRAGHTSIWTGSEMIVWGGADNTGGRYNPLTDTWVSGGTSTINAPTSRVFHTAVWSGSEMIVFGGKDASAAMLDTGGRYNPSTDTWVPGGTSTMIEPSPREEHTAVWTGSEMIIWGGGFTNTGARYDPATDAWADTSTINAPSARLDHTAVWTGTEMIVWGGTGDTNGTNTGGRYSPTNDTWAPNGTSTTNAPFGRDGHTAIWTGTQMIIWGGMPGNPQTNTGGLYDPVSDTWFATPAPNWLEGRTVHTAVWTGSEMIIWGGIDDHTDTGFTNTGYRYNPSEGRWEPINEWGPQARDAHTAVWTGSRMIVWGGAGMIDDTTIGELNSGGIYDPSSDSWFDTSMENAPSKRALHTAIWTGSEMIVWGGEDETVGRFNTGGRFDPVTNSWVADGTNLTDAPSERAFHSAVWTGNEMIVWGGLGSTSILNTGGLYCTTGFAPVIPTIAINDISVAEGQSGTSLAKVTVTLSEPSNLGTSVDFETASDTATGSSDYNSTSGTLTIPPGSTEGTISIAINGDVEIEPDETFFVNLSNPINGTISDSQAIVTITNDDPYLTISDVSLPEGNRGKTKLEFVVSLSSPVNSTVKVNYTTTDGTATVAGNDYLPRTRTAKIHRGETTAVIKIKVKGDKVTEGDETFTVDLSNAVGATISDPQGVGTILNDD